MKGQDLILGPEMTHHRLVAERLELLARDARSRAVLTFVGYA